MLSIEGGRSGLVGLVPVVLLFDVISIVDVIAVANAVATEMLFVLGWSGWVERARR